MNIILMPKVIHLEYNKTNSSILTEIIAEDRL
jgi:hypothetical protein